MIVVSFYRKFGNLKTLRSQFGRTSFTIINELSIGLCLVFRFFTGMVVTGSITVDILVSKHLILYLRRSWTFGIFPSIILLAGFCIVSVLVLTIYKRNLMVKVKVIIYDWWNFVVRWNDVCKKRFIFSDYFIG